MKSPVIKRSIVIAGHKTSVSLEDAFWKGLKDIAIDRHMTLSDLVASIDGGRHHGNLSAAIRLFVLDHYRSQGGSDRTERRETESPTTTPPEIMLVQPTAPAVLRVE
jgi:predicted DNA-binding ribbon-helix-helix protein